MDVSALLRNWWNITPGSADWLRLAEHATWEMIKGLLADGRVEANLLNIKTRLDAESTTWFKRCDSKTAEAIINYSNGLHILAAFARAGELKSYIYFAHQYNLNCKDIRKCFYASRDGTPGVNARRAQASAAYKQICSLIVALLRMPAAQAQGAASSIPNPAAEEAFFLKEMEEAAKEEAVDIAAAEREEAGIANDMLT